MRIKCSQAIKYSFTGLVAITLLNSCDLNPLQSNIPGNQWILQVESADGITTNPYTSATAFGASSSLYVGTRENIEAGSLIRFEMPDSSVVVRTQSVTLYIFPKDTNLVFSNFYLDLIHSADNDTSWAEGDTGLTLAQFADVEYIADSVMVKDTVAYFISSTIRDTAEIAFVKFSVDPVVLQNWKFADVANNGFLITTNDNLTMSSFYSSYGAKNPYLLIEYTASDSDTTVYRGFLKPTHDTYVIDDNTALNPAGLSLNFVQGHRLHVDISGVFEPDVERPIAGGRITLFKAASSQIEDSEVTLYVLLRDSVYSAEDDTSLTIVRSVTMDATADSLVISITGMLQDVVAGSKENFGFDLLVNPLNNDFDDLVFHDNSDTTGLKPKLEILYAIPYSGLD